MEKQKKINKMLDKMISLDSLQRQKLKNSLSRIYEYVKLALLCVTVFVLISLNYDFGYNHGHIQTAMRVAGNYEDPCLAAHGVFLNKTCFIGNGSYSYEIYPNLILSADETNPYDKLVIWYLSGIVPKKYSSSTVGDE